LKCIEQNSDYKWSSFRALTTPVKVKGLLGGNWNNHLISELKMLSADSAFVGKPTAAKFLPKQFYLFLVSSQD
jgi:hypothetical protein